MCRAPLLAQTNSVTCLLHIRRRNSQLNRADEKVPAGIVSVDQKWYETEMQLGSASTNQQNCAQSELRLCALSIERSDVIFARFQAPCALFTERFLDCDDSYRHIKVTKLLNEIRRGLLSASHVFPSVHHSGCRCTVLLQLLLQASSPPAGTTTTAIAR